MTPYHKHLKNWNQSASRNRFVCKAVVVLDDKSTVKFNAGNGAFRKIQDLPENISAVFQIYPAAVTGVHSVLSAEGKPFMLHSRGKDIASARTDLIAKLRSHRVREVKMKDPAFRLEDMLKAHDWYYAYSDDGSVVRRGCSQSDAIAEAMKAVDPEVAKSLWNTHAPEEFSRR